MTGKEFMALPHVPEEIQHRCDVYLRTIPAYEDADFNENDYRFVMRDGILGVLVRISSRMELSFCPIAKI